MQKLTTLLVALALAGCGQMPDVPTMISPYKIDIQQGNVVTQEMVAKLKPGMTRAQVRFALGSPLIVDPFRTDRWDYVYMYQKQGQQTETRRIIVIFQDDKLLRIEGDVVPQDPSARPAEKPAAKPAATAAPKPVAAPAAAPKAEPMGPAAAPPDGAKPEAKADAAPNEAPITGAPKTETVKSDPAPAKPDAPKEKPKEEKGFFGRMLDKIGF